MSDFKSKMPDFNEITTMATKLFKDVKNSVCGIVEMYKQKRATEASTQQSKPEKEEPAPKAEPTATPTDEKKE